MSDKLNLIKAEYKGDSYEIHCVSPFVADMKEGDNFFDYFFLDNEAEVTVLKNGEPMTEFGVSFAGNAYGAADFLYAAIAAYANDMPDFKAIEVSDSIQYVRNIVQDEFHHEGKTAEGISKHFLNTNGVILDLEFATFDNAGYASESGECAYVDLKTGDVITDVIEFYEEASISEVKNKSEFTYKSDDFIEYVEKPTLKDIEGDIEP
jgi:hypothetical protein